MNNSLEKLNKVFDISDLLYAQEKEKNIAKLNGKLEREFQSGSVTYSTLEVYFMVILNTIKHLINCRVDFDINEVNNLIETKIKKSLSSVIFKKISKRALQTIEEEFKYLIDEVTRFSKDLFPGYMLGWINEEIGKEKIAVLKKIKTDIEIQEKRHKLRSDGKELSKKQEKDYEKYGYNCKDRIYIPGTPSVNRNCIILLNGKETKIKDANFLLLLRFVVELKKGKGGKVHLTDLEKDKTIPSRTYYQYIDRLNDDLKINVMFCKDDKKDLIESVGAGYFQISTHPDFVSYNLENLLNYPGNGYIRDLAKRLEEIEKNL